MQKFDLSLKFKPTTCIIKNLYIYNIIWFFFSNTKFIIIYHSHIFMDFRDAYFQEDLFRFATLLLASLVSLISSSINFTFPPIAPTLEFSFNTNSYDLYILTISYSVIYLFFSIPASFFIEKYGIRKSLLTCMILQSVGINFFFVFI